MEFHQVRYFLALSTTLNFTRAAEMCNVTQPALTRAIKLLEHEFGGPLIIREQRLSHLTELGQRVLPVLQECYKKALAAKALARAENDRSALRLAVVGSVDLARLSAPLEKIFTEFPDTEISVMRGSNEEILEFLKAGDASLAISDSDIGTWERLDSWIIDREPYVLVANERHPLATAQPVPMAELFRQRLICLPYCSLAKDLLEMADQEGETSGSFCEVATMFDIFALLQLNAGVALLPREQKLPEGLVHLQTEGMELAHDTRLFAVAGRRRNRPTMKFINYFDRQVQDVVTLPQIAAGALELKAASFVAAMA